MNDGYLKGITDGSDKCECHQCIEEKNLRSKHIDGIDFIGTMPLSATKMILCGKCGNKRCPQASNHRNECTHSNKSGQYGSLYK